MRCTRPRFPQPLTLLTAAALLLSGCASSTMKGSPFFTGEYAVNVPGAEARRVNAWPLAYYREPALSVLWPVFELTEEHLAVRPLFSAYGDTDAYWEYNLLWPFCQADTRGRDYRVFPFFWGTDIGRDGSERSYQTLFPIYWRRARESFALFPLWLDTRSNWNGTRFEDRDLELAWPLFRYHAGAQEQAWRAALFGRSRFPVSGETYAGYPWPLLFSWSAPHRRGLFTPLYAYERGDTPEHSDGWSALPLLLAWHRWSRDSHDLNALLGFYNQHWSENTRSGYLFPLCAYDRSERLFLTPLFGWDRPDAGDPAGYWYPLTPLVGVRTGTERGGWLYPLFDRTKNITNGNSETHALLLGHASHTHTRRENGDLTVNSVGFAPLFDHTTTMQTSTNREEGVARESFSRDDNQLVLRSSSERRTVCRSLPDRPAAASTNAPLADVSTHSRANGLFPLWWASAFSEAGLDGKPLRENADLTLLLALYDSKHRKAAAQGDAPATDYLRRRVLWRLWHYERRDGDVSVDLFPTVTYDARTDGFRKVSFLWRFFRYERAPQGGVDLDLLFVPLARAP